MISKTGKNQFYHRYKIEFHHDSKSKISLEVKESTVRTTTR